MAIYRKGEGLWSRGGSAAILFGIALFGCKRLAAMLGGLDWGRSRLLSTPVGDLTGSWLVAGILLAGCCAGLWMLLNHAKAVDFLVDMEGELRKVSWPVDPSQSRFSDRYRELLQSTLIVILSVVVMGVALFVYDILLAKGVGAILGA